MYALHKTAQMITKNNKTFNKDADGGNPTYTGFKGINCEKKKTEQATFFLFVLYLVEQFPLKNLTHANISLQLISPI